MEAAIRISKTDLARNTRQVINDVLRGQAAFIESHGKPEAAIIDIVDYRILRAVMRYHASRPKIDASTGLSEVDLQRSRDVQGRYDQVMAHYLAGSISLGREPSCSARRGWICGPAVCGSMCRCRPRR